MKPAGLERMWLASLHYWPGLYEFLVDLRGYVNLNFINIRVLEQHGVLVFAVVPLTEDAADELAGGLEKCVRWRSENPPRGITWRIPWP